MSGGHGNHVDNSIWSRAILMGGFILTIGIISFAALGLGVATVKHDTYDEAKTAYYDAIDDPTVSDSELDKLHHKEIDAHLSYLTYRVAGITILVVSFIYAVFLAVGGFINSIQPQEDHGHDDHHGDDQQADEHSESGQAKHPCGNAGFTAGFAGCENKTVCAHLPSLPRRPTCGCDRRRSRRMWWTSTLATPSGRARGASAWRCRSPRRNRILRHR